MEDSLLVILIIDVCAPLTQDPRELEIVELGSQSTAEDSVNVSVHVPVNVFEVNETSYLQVMVPPSDTA